MDPARVLLEVCVDSVESAVNAVSAGADRLEVCGNLGLGGGTTPSLGLVKSIQRSVKDVPLMVMIRPRVGDFVYSRQEIETMLEDIRIFKICAVRGVVFGVLTKDGVVDVESLKRLADEALPMEICFHRAFDLTRDPVEALRDVINVGGISRILTSGHGRKAPDNIPSLQALFRTLKELVEEDVWGPNIMPGSGINAETIPTVVSQLLSFGLCEMHLSGGEWIESEMVFRREGMDMGLGNGKDWSIWRTSQDKVREAKSALGVVWTAV
ncbi:copper homeostasis CutC domain-containing protein [Cyathus striatus]|nr:copper homeostasis CutC domain-containing protein [Cyathus striatus]